MFFVFGSVAVIHANSINQYHYNENNRQKQDCGKIIRSSFNQRLLKFHTTK